MKSKPPHKFVFTERGSSRKTRNHQHLAPTAPFSPTVTVFDGIILFFVWCYFLLLFISAPQPDIRISFLLNSFIGVIFWHEYFHFVAASLVGLLLDHRSKGERGYRLLQFSKDKKELPQTFSNIIQIFALIDLFLFPAGLLSGLLPLTLELHWTFFLSPPGLMFLEFIGGTFLEQRERRGHEVLGVRIIPRIRSLGVRVPKEIFFKSRWVRRAIISPGFMGSLVLGLSVYFNPFGFLNSFFTPDASLPSYPAVVYACSVMHITLGATTLLLGILPFPLFRCQDGFVLMEHSMSKDLPVAVENSPEEIIEAGGLIRKLRNLRGLFEDFEDDEDKPERIREIGEEILDEFARLKADRVLEKYDVKSRFTKALGKYSQKKSITRRPIKEVMRRMDDMERTMRAVHPEFMALIRPHPNNPWARDIYWDELESDPDQSRQVLLSLDRILNSHDEEEIKETVAAIPGVMRLSVLEVPNDILSNSLTVLEKIMERGPGGFIFMRGIFEAFYHAAGYAEALAVDLPAYLKRGLAVKIGLTRDAGAFSARQFTGISEEILDWAFPSGTKEPSPSRKGETASVSEEIFSPSPGERPVIASPEYLYEDSIVGRVVEAFSRNNHPPAREEILELEEIWLPMAETILELRERLQKERIVVALGGIPGQKKERSTAMIRAVMKELGRVSGVDGVLLKMAEFSLDRHRLEKEKIFPGSPEAFDVLSFLRCAASLKEGKSAKRPQWKFSENLKDATPFFPAGADEDVFPAKVLLLEGTYVLKKDDILRPASAKTDVRAYHLLPSLIDFSIFIMHPRNDRLARQEIFPTSQNADLVLEEENGTIQTLWVPKIGKRFKARGFQWEGYLESVTRWKISGSVLPAGGA